MLLRSLKAVAGNWGEVAMPPHATMPEADAQKIAQYVLSLSNKTSAKPTLPAQGQIIPEASSDENTTFVINASYTDAGSAGVKPLTGSGAAYLRSNIINARELTQRARLTLRDSTTTGLIVYPQTDGWLKLSRY